MLRFDREMIFFVLVNGKKETLVVKHDHASKVTTSLFGKHVETRRGKKLSDETLFPLIYAQGEFDLKVLIKY